jgi:hypothetical protein
MVEESPRRSGAPGQFSASRAITIDAPSERVWPWIVQIGQRRGGFTVMPWIENLFGCKIVKAETTMLLIRWRSQMPHTVYDLVCNKYLLEPIHFFMERKMMFGIRTRALSRRVNPL